MSGIDLLRTSPPARAFGHARAVSTALAARGWTVTGSVVDPAVDVAANRAWRGRSDVHAHIHLLVQIDAAADRNLLFDAAPPAVPDESLPFYWIGEHDLGDRYQASVERLAFVRGEARIARAIATAPPSPLLAAAWRDANDEGHPAIERAFASAADAERAFFRHDAEVLRDDAELAVVEAADLVGPLIGELHHFFPVVVTDASMWNAHNDLAPVTRVRVVRRRLAEAGHLWIDIVHTSAIDAFVDAVTMHFTALYSRRRFTGLA